MPLPPAPMGERGARPVLFHTHLAYDQLTEVLSIPGVGWYPGIVLCAWDTAPKVARLLNCPVPIPPDNLGFEAPGMAEYQQYAFTTGLRGYQKDLARFLLRRAYGLGAFPARTGKSPPAIAGAVALGAARVLIVCPRGAAYSWADEICKWTGQAAVLLEGRGAREAHQYCTTCKGTGLIDGNDCPACPQLNGQSYGYHIVEVRQVAREVPEEARAARAAPTSKRAATTAPTATPRMRLNLLKPPPMGPRLPRKAEVVAALKAEAKAATYRCSIHPEVQTTDPELYCASCWQRLYQLLSTTRWVIVTYDCLVAQEHRGGRQQLLGERPDLLGWTPMLSALPWDLAIVDEARKIRGRVKKDRRGKARADRVWQVLKHVPRAWGLDATPVGGKTSHAWGILNLLSQGLFGTSNEFDRRYCEGHQDASHGGWVNDGRSALADTELVERLQTFMFRRERADILPEMPEKIWVPIRIDGSKTRPKSPSDPTDDSDGDSEDTSDAGHAGHAGTLGLGGAGASSLYGRAIGATFDEVLETALENVLDELEEGSTYALTFHPANAVKFAAAVEKAVAAGADGRWKGSRVRPMVFLAAGRNPKARADMAKAYCLAAANGGKNLFVGTHGAMQEGGVSLFGALSTHVIEPHWDPDVFIQAVDRPNLPGITRGLSVLLYMIRRSYVERVYSVLGPKLSTQFALMKDSDARAMQTALVGARESSEAILARLTAHLS